MKAGKVVLATFLKKKLFGGTVSLVLVFGLLCYQELG